MIAMRISLIVCLFLYEVIDPDHHSKKISRPLCKGSVNEEDIKFRRLITVDGKLLSKNLRKYSYSEGFGRLLQRQPNHHRSHP